ncbi:MAG: DNA repair and recombination protein RadB [Thermoplasmata archaeon]|nr:MAG: DNA repair and recombination protein RadB [Thermoplasmata archaeon]
MKKLPIDCENLDDALKGGLEAGIVTEIYGEGGSGKTTLCMQLSRNCILSKLGKVVYIDTEGFSIERLEQICGKDFEGVSREILFFEPYNLDEQEECVDKIIKMVLETDVEIAMIILDSATVYYRLTLGSDNDLSGRRSLSEQIIKLMALARKKKLFVIVTSQVYTDIETNEFLPLGGHILSHNAKTILKLRRYESNLRSMSIMKHRSLDQTDGLYFRLADIGLSPEKAPKLV